MIIPLVIIAAILLLPAMLAQHALQQDGHSRALSLLKQWLSPEQLASYELFQFFDVTGSDSGHVFRIYYGTQMNIEKLNNSGSQFVDGASCQMDIWLPAIMLVQKIALETILRGLG